MKKTKMTALIVAVIMVLTLVPPVAGASTVAYSDITFTSTSPTGFDMVGKSLHVASNLTEKYYPEITGEPEGKVSVSDAIVAAHIEKYGSAFEKNPKNYYDISNGQYGTLTAKQFGHNTVGLYYVNGTSIATNVSADTVKSGDAVEICAYKDGDNSWADLYSKFGATNYKAVEGQVINVKLTADNFGTSVIPSDVKLQTVNATTGFLSEMKGVTTDKDGIAKIKFDKEGTYYISAVGSVKYTGWSGETTGNIMCPLAKVVVSAKAPTTPKNVKAAAVGWTKIKISWNKVSGATKYNVYRATKKDGDYKKVKVVKTNKWTNTKLKTGKKYYYKVKAVKPTSTSKYSKIVSSSATAKAPGLKLVAGKNKIKATWAKVEGATGYKLYRASAKTGKYKAIRNAKGSWNREYTSLNKKAGKKYYYKVRAYKKINGKIVLGNASVVKTKAAK